MAVRHSGQALEARWRKIPYNGSDYENNNYLVREQVKPGRREGFKPWIYQCAAYWAVGVVSVLCYCNSLYGDLVHDDVFAIKGNQDIRGSTPWINLLRNDFWGKNMADNTSHKSYRPLCVLTFRLNYAIHGLSPYGYHVTNVALHVITSLLLLYTCRHLVFPRTSSASSMAAILFAVHPIHTEAVSGIVGRADVLACLLVLLAFNVYVRCIQIGREEELPATENRLYLPVVVCLAAAAMLSKETGITVLGICFLYDVLVISRNGIIRCIQTRSFQEFLVSHTCMRLAVLFLSTLVLVSVRLWVMNGEMPVFSDQDNPASHSNDTLTRVLSYGYIAAYNTWLLVCPSVLSYDWQMNSLPLVESLLDVRNAATLLLLVSVLWLVFNTITTQNTEDRRVICASLLFLILPFIPASNVFIRVGFVVAERILYIPSIGFCILVAHGVQILSYKYKRKKAWIQWFYIALLMLFGFRTVVRNQVWSSRDNLFLSGVQTLPHNAKMHYNYANLMKDIGKSEIAVPHYRQTLRLWPNHASASNNLGTLVNNDTEAEMLYEDALRISDHKHAGAYFNLGNMFHHQGRREEAIAALESAFRLDPSCPDVASSLAVMKENQGDILEAERLLKDLAETHRDGDSIRRYAAFLYRTGRIHESFKMYQEAFTKNPNDQKALLESATVLRNLGDSIEASKLINRALALDQNAETLDTAGVFHFNTGNIEAALTLFKSAKEMDKNDIKIKIHMAQALASSGRYQEAVQELQESLKKEPDNTEAMLHISKIYGVINKHMEALELLEKAVQLTLDASHKANILFEIGNHLKDIKEYKKALSVFEQSISLNPDMVEAHLNIGVLHHIEERYNQAKHHYDIAYTLDPDNHLLKTNMKKLERVLKMVKI